MIKNRAIEKQRRRDEDARRLQNHEISPEELGLENDFFACFRNIEFRFVAIGRRKL